MVALITSTEGNFQASGEHGQRTKHHSPISLEHESHVEDEKGSAFDSGSGVASGSGRKTKIYT